MKITTKVSNRLQVLPNRQGDLIEEIQLVKWNKSKLRDEQMSGDFNTDHSYLGSDPQNKNDVNTKQAP